MCVCVCVWEGGCASVIVCPRAKSAAYPLTPPLPRPPSRPAAALADVSEMVVQLHGTMIKMENFQKLLELKKDLTAIDNLAVPGRVRNLTSMDLLSKSFQPTSEIYKALK